MRALFGLMFSCALVACSDSPKTLNDISKTIDDINWQLKPKYNGEVPNNQSVNSYRVAITGNSHVAGLGAEINKVITQLTPQKQTVSETIGSGFLDDSIRSSSATQALESGNWTHLILQGQKYSQSRTTTYSTTAAEKWIANAKELNVMPILFPEHPQRGDTTEAQYVYGLHSDIVAKQASCLAPVGLVWDSVLQLMPNLRLHASDGNHAAPLGKYLTALVFAEVITGQRVDSVILTPVNGVRADEQLLMAQVVSEVIYQLPPCPFSESSKN